MKNRLGAFSIAYYSPDGHLMNSMMGEPSASLSRLTLLGSKDIGIEKSLAAMGVLSVLSAVAGLLSILLLFELKQQSFDTNKDLTVISQLEIYDNLLDCSIVLTTVCSILNLGCTVISAIHSYFASKMMKLSQGEERSNKFLKRTSGTRFLAISSFFVSVPLLVAALGLYLFLAFRFIPAVISSCFLGLAIIVVVTTFSYNCHLWREEQKRASLGLGPYELPPSSPSEKVLNGDAKHSYSSHFNHTDRVDSPVNNPNVSTLSTLV